MNTISNELLYKIERVINKYSLVNGKDVFVAYSGGKDSMFLCNAMQQLGYQVFPIIIDRISLRLDTCVRKRKKAQNECHAFG